MASLLDSSPLRRSGHDFYTSLATIAGRSTAKVLLMKVWLFVIGPPRATVFGGCWELHLHNSKDEKNNTQTNRKNNATVQTNTVETKYIGTAWNAWCVVILSKHLPRNCLWLYRELQPKEPESVLFSRHFDRNHLTYCHTAISFWNTWVRPKNKSKVLHVYNMYIYISNKSSHHVS